MGRRHGVASVLEDLLVALGNSPPPDRLRELVREGLQDETLEIAFWSPERNGYVDIDGRLIRHVEGSSRIVSQLPGESPATVLIHDRAVLRDAARLQTVVAAARLALNNAGLRAQLRAQLEAVRESRARIVRASDVARHRLERDLRRRVDEPLERLMEDLSAAGSVLDAGDRSSAGLVARGLAEARAARDEIRALAQGVYPAVLAEGIGSALRWLAGRSNVPITLTVQSDAPLPPSVEACIYFVCAEAITNTVKYAGATEGTVRLGRDGTQVWLTVEDDGIGGATIIPGGGLAGLRDRVEALGGTLSISSTAGGGTMVSLVIGIDERQGGEERPRRQ